MQQLLTTAEVCKILGITPTKLRRLTHEGYLEVEEITKMKHGDLHLYHPAEVDKLQLQMPRILRRWESEENTAMGAKKAALMRSNRINAAHGLKSRKEEFLLSLDLAPEKTANLLRASYFLFHLNHYAKAGNHYLYDLKEKVLKKFVEHYNEEHGLTISLVQGGQRVLLCPSCKRKARRQRKSYHDYARMTGGCPWCIKNDRYYSLYEFTVKYAEHRFCFHTPYNVAKKWLKDKATTTKFRAQRYEMGTAFGRPIFELEAQAIPLQEVIDELNYFLEHLDYYYLKA
ncbi:helix-turn-helix domain-containing protein [Desulfofalx alkaliphila]|uniref:helix-turn-helix domain-containing protein n=1 Tax=Desulfofalx alkaliphila TaxID=105483 RepID=UPI000A58BA28